MPQGLAGMTLSHRGAQPTGLAHITPSFTCGKWLTHACQSPELRSNPEVCNQ